MLALRSDINDLLRELITLGCVEISEPGDLLNDPEIAACVEIETVDLQQFNAGKDSINALGTESTLLLRSWTPAAAESSLLSVLSRHTCAWESHFPRPEELPGAPIKLRFPKLFGPFFRRKGKPFDPLAIAAQNAI